MQSKINFSRLSLIVFLVNLIGFALKYFNLSEYIIIAGFRFHLSFVLPLLFVVKKRRINIIKEIIIHPSYKKFYILFFWILAPISLTLLSLFIFNKIKIADTYRFYELGLSSIIDYPIYLLWNLPQIILLGAFLSMAMHERKFKLLILFLLTASLFIYEFIPLNEEIIFSSNLIFSNILPVILIAAITGILIKYFPNIYIFSAATFSILWIYFLCFGSQSKTIVNLLFAANYDSWDGFFNVDKNLNSFMLSGFLLLTLLIIIISAFKKKKS